MAKLIFKLKSVPEDEADDIKNLLADNKIDYYESPAGNWEISVHALWLNDESQSARAKQLIDELFLCNTYLFPTYFLPFQPIFLFTRNQTKTGISRCLGSDSRKY